MSAKSGRSPSPKAGHTPGPWKSDGVRVGDGQGRFLAIVNEIGDQREANHNAHLMSAAPELLALCEEVLATQTSLDPAVCERMFAAIKKARGRLFE
jgi:hypothetical protein